MQNLRDLLEDRATHRPDALAYRFLPEGDTQEDIATYADLAQHAREESRSLLDRAKPGDRVILAHEHDQPIAFLHDFFACVYAGLIAVPSQAPRRLKRDARFDSILEDSCATLVLGASGYADFHRPSGAAATRDCALLQYTSGSVAAPRGVMVTHANILANQQAMASALHHGEGAAFVSWLPLYHDMGLIAGALQPLFAGIPCTLLSPSHFLQKPLRWLEAIGRYCATVSGAPDFAYALCVDTATPAQREQLDLSTWEVAFNGAEPVRRTTLSAFERAFAASGFKSRSWFPCYGLAEATLFVTGPEKGAYTPGDVSHSVSCGSPLPAHAIAIVNPESKLECAPGEAGEIWVAGPSVAAGYWNRPEETASVFSQPLAGYVGLFMRTGDGGTISPAGLIVHGRLDDMVIVRGRNIYAEDIESAARSAFPAETNVVLAAVPEEQGNQGFVLLVEYPQTERHGNAAAAFETDAAGIAGILSEEFGATPSAVIFVRRHALPRTTSGKVRRRLVARQLAEGALRIVWRSDTDSIAAYTHPAQELLATIDSRAAALWSPDYPLNRLGLDSLQTVQWQHALDQSTGYRLPISFLLSSASCGDLMSRIAAKDHVAPDSIAALDYADGQSVPLSVGQKGIYLQSRIEPKSSAYCVARAVFIPPEITAEKLNQALDVLLRRHASLRMVVHESVHEPMQRTAIDPSFHLPVTDAAGWSKERLRSAIEEDVYRPFHLQLGPVFRAHLYIWEQPILAISVHHMFADQWSLEVVAGELQKLLQSGPQQLPPPSESYANFVRWQQSWLGSDEVERQWQYWRTELAKPQSPDQHSSKARMPESANRANRNLRFALPDAAAMAETIARELGVTAFCVLLACFGSTLARQFGRRNLRVGVVGAGRTDGRFDNTVGYFANPFAVWLNLDAVTSRTEAIREANRALRAAMDNGDFPFALLVERLHPRRSAGDFPFFDFALRKIASLPAGLEEFRIAGPDLQVPLSLSAADHYVELDAMASHYDDEEIQALAQRFGVLLRSWMRSPGTQELTPNQYLIWSAQQHFPDAPIFNMPFVFTLRGAMRPEIFSEAFEALIRSSDILRMVIDEAGAEPLLHAIDPSTVELIQIDFSSEPMPAGAADRWMAARRSIPLRMDRPMVDAALIRLGLDCWVFYLNQHQLITDGRSILNILSQLGNLYRRIEVGEVIDTVPLSQFADYVRWEAAQRETESFRQSELYWQSVVRNFHVTPSSKAIATATERISRELDNNRMSRLHERVRHPAFTLRSENAAMFNFFAATMASYLHLGLETSPAVFAAPFHSRTSPELAETIGSLMHPYPFVVAIGPRSTFADLVTSISRQAVEIGRHLRYAVRNPLHDKLYDAMLNYQVTQFPALPGMEMKTHWLHSGHDTVGFTVQVSDYNGTGNLQLDFDFRCDLFSQADREAAMQSFLALLDAVLEDPWQEVHRGLLHQGQPYFLHTRDAASRAELFLD